MRWLFSIWGRNGLVMGFEWNYKNDKYASNALLQKKYVVDHLTKNLLRNKGTLSQYYAENTHPAIINQEIFEKAQLIMRQRNGQREKKPKQEYPFTGKIICEKCGKHYNRKATHGHVYWNCKTFLHFGKSICHTKQIPEEI